MIRNVAALVKNGRQKKNMTQAILSGKLGFTSPQFISNIERSLSQLPVKHFKKVSKFTGISVDELIDAEAKDYKEILKRQVSKSK